MRYWLAAVAATGCNAVFDIGTTGPLDASLVPSDVDYDLDGDGVVDRLDNCPIIGDTCDLLTTPQRRVFFDGSPTSPMWTTPWDSVFGSLVPMTFPSEMKLIGVPLTADADLEWHVEARVDIDTTATSPQDLIFALRLTNPNTNVAFECGIATTTNRTTGYARTGLGAIIEGPR